MGECPKGQNYLNFYMEDKNKVYPLLNILANKIGMEIGVTTLLPVGRGLIVPLSLEPFKYFWDIEGFGKLTSRKINMLIVISFNILERNTLFCLQSILNLILLYEFLTVFHL